MAKGQLEKPALRIGIAGLGTVGQGVLKLLEANRDLLEARAGRPLEVKAVSARSRTKHRDVDLAPYRFVDRAEDLAHDPELDLVVEVIGGASGVAKQLVESCLKAGKAVVTANKALLAEHGNELGELCRRKSLHLGFEAAVAGGIPVIKLLREGLVANRINRLYGILNGTSNFILSTMEQEQIGFDQALKIARDKGYAETDPSFDISGVDAAHKLALLSSLAFGCAIDFASIETQGITHLRTHDMKVAADLGYRVKQLAMASPRYNSDASPLSLEQWVRPVLVRTESSIAAISGVTNAITFEADFVGELVISGPGAGMEPTASAVVADLLDFARGMSLSLQGLTGSHAQKLAHARAHAGEARRYFLRVTVLDQPGVMAHLATLLNEEGLSIESLLQQEGREGEPVDIVVVTHACENHQIEGLVRKLDSEDWTEEQALVMPVFEFSQA